MQTGACSSKSERVCRRVQSAAVQVQHAEVCVRQAAERVMAEDRKQQQQKGRQ